jgi:3',5'-nucleoside bisphosphate phosphatase
MFREYRCDLHIHTCLSPCADLDMHPAALISGAAAQRLDVIAICDHNASENVRYVMQAAEHETIGVIAGMEITTSEEVHILALMPGLRALAQIQEIVYDRLPGRNDERLFGCQAVVNEKGEVEQINERLLIGATEIPMSDLIKTIHSLGGLAVASHIDRESFSVISQLGFVDEDSGLDALEISRALGVEKARKRYPELSHHTFVASSDAHCLADIGSAVTMMRLAEATFEEVKLAIQHREGRCVIE